MRLTIGRGPVTQRGYARPGAGDNHRSDGYEWDTSVATPDPDPGLGVEIREQHDREVAAAADRLGTTDPDRIAADIYLHPWNVRRALESLGLARRRDPLQDRRTAARRAVDEAARFLAGKGPTPSPLIAAACGLGTSRTVLLLRMDARFRQAGYGPRGPFGKRTTLWELASEGR